MSRCKFALEKPFEGGASCLKQTTARKKSRLLSRSLAFISIFCVFALLFTSLTPLSVFADDPALAVEENQGGTGSPKTNGGNAEQPPVDPGKKGESVDPEKPETPVGEPENNSETPRQPGPPDNQQNPGKPADSKDLKQLVNSINQENSDPQVGQYSVQKNNDSAPELTLVIKDVQAGDAKISGEIKTEGPLPIFNLIVDKNNGEKYTAEPELERDPTVPNSIKWTIPLPDKLLPLGADDKITITIKIPEMDWELSKSAEVQSTKSGDSELEISDVNIPDPVGGKIKAPSIDPVLIDATTISGGDLAKDRINNKLVIATVHVILKDSSGIEKAKLSVTPKSGTTWKVDLPGNVKVEKGDTVTVYQQIGEDKSKEVTEKAQPSKASTVTLTMPNGEIWVEQYVANILNDDEKAEAIDLLKKANPTIAGDIKSVEFKITGEDPKTASYIVTYTDNSKTAEIQAPDLTVKKVTETSRSPEIDSITVVDNVVKGRLAGSGPFGDIKVKLVLNVKKEKADQYCNEHKCTVDKDSSEPVGITLQNDGTFSYTLKAGDSLELDQIVGVTVKEPHKFVSCSTTTVKPVTVGKTEVRDPRKLTAEDKKAIDVAIRKAYTVDGVSKLPNGTGDHDGVPAVIQFDDSGNVKIFSGNNVAGTWDPNNNYKFVPETNEDGSYKLKDVLIAT